MADRDWYNDLQQAYTKQYQASPDIIYLKTVRGAHLPLRLGEVLKHMWTNSASPAETILGYFHGLDPEALAKQIVDVIIKLGTVIALCNMVVAKMAKTDPIIIQTYKINYFTDHPNLITISFNTLENIPVTITLNFVRLINIVYSCTINDRFCSLDNFPKKLKKVVFGK